MIKMLSVVLMASLVVAKTAIDFSLPDFTINVPVPPTLLAMCWFLIGINFGRSFGKQLDQDIQGSDWYKNLHPNARWILKRVLDFTHHWWIGLLLVVYSYRITWSWWILRAEEIYWFGWGLFVDDLPDVPRRYPQLKDAIENFIYKDEEE